MGKEPLVKIRVVFSKTGAMKYVGHLDFMRFFQKAMGRARIPVRYSGGFSPHQIMSFVAPLSVGVEGLREYFDAEIQE
ncbi:MAG: TIGR03936 family radical SAM-associated protein, partial [Lachnospiraceae bacterium]|nr:TIGR03936 family radical SAM-associated protein [Lachnospiraceae bacterium]